MDSVQISVAYEERNRNVPPEGPPACEARSFAQTTIAEAVARHARVDLVLKPVTPGTDQRLISRFLGTQGDDLVLDTPWKGNNDRVFVPVGWDIGMAFESANLWVQTRTEILGHCLFLMDTPQRVDGLIVRRPAKILSTRPGRKPRHRVHPATPVAATVWPAKSLQDADDKSAHRGQLVNWSQGGLCIALHERPRFVVGAKLLIRLQTFVVGHRPILQGTVVHYSVNKQGLWQVGFGSVREVDHV